MRIAVVGSGISGLTAAHLLAEVHEVTVFEAGDRIGGHTHTVEAESAGRTFRVDTGFIVFNGPNYPLFNRLLDRLGVPWKATAMSFSVRCDRTGLEYASRSLNAVFAQRSNLLRPKFWGMLRDIRRFQRDGPMMLAADDSVSVADYLAATGRGCAFADHYLIPLGSSLWSCPPERFLGFPIRFVAEFLSNHCMLQMGGQPSWRVIEGGSFRYLEKLAARFRGRVRLNSPVCTVARTTREVVVAAAGAPAEHFDEIVIASHADQSLAMLADATPTERALLSAFPYQENEVVLHTDESVLPHRARARASWNYRIPADGPERAVVTYDMTRLQELDGPERFCVTLNDSAGIAPERVLRRLTYHHPLYTRRRREAQAAHREVIRANRTSFCGAYWGFGFHEDGVRSALEVCRAFGKEL